MEKSESLIFEENSCSPEIGATLAQEAPKWSFSLFSLKDSVDFPVFWVEDRLSWLY